MGEDFENGFQVKDVKIQLLTVTDVNPTLEEVTRFASGAEDGTENLDLKALAASLKDSNASTTYLPGDVIEVYAGEQMGVVGRASSVQGDIVTLIGANGAGKTTTLRTISGLLRPKSGSVQYRGEQIIGWDVIGHNEPLQSICAPFRGRQRVASVQWRTVQGRKLVHDV